MWPPSIQKKSSGFVLMALITLLLMISLGTFLHFLNQSDSHLLRRQAERKNMLTAKQIVIGATTTQDISKAGYLPNPDNGWTIGNPTEGNEGGSQGGMGIHILGKLPWKSIGSMPLRDSAHECLWYLVSGHWKNSPRSTSPLNWDTEGALQVVDTNNQVIASNLVALIFAPAQPVNAQNRAISNNAYTECGGNYVPANYLDPWPAPDLASYNYFTGTPTPLVSPTSAPLTFKTSTLDNTSLNDQITGITVTDIFNPIIKRPDFKETIATLMSSTLFKTIAISGTHGTDFLDCSLIDTGMTPSPALQQFCTNWKDMLWLTALPTPTSISIDGAATPICQRVLIFAGSRLSTQQRSTLDERNSSENYLEEPNVNSFQTPTATGVNFSGAGSFAWQTPSTDLIRCIQ